MRPPFPYFGGKQTLAARIVSHFPSHSHYVEPFAGSLAVLLAKPPSKMETVNDLDGELFNFWRVLRDQPQELLRLCEMTPHSRAEHDASYNQVDEPLERARRVWVQLTQGRSGMRRRTGWRYYIDPDGSSVSMTDYVRGYVERMPAAAARLRRVSLECRPALEVVEAYGKFSDALLYVDPPYLGSVRNGAQYAVEMHTDAEHEELAEALAGCSAAVVLSGYHSPLYDRLYDGWERLEMLTFNGNARDTERTEVLWSNRAPQDVLDFGGVA